MATTSDRPRFRQDLIAEAIDDNNAKFVDVLDPENGTLFRFYEVEFSLACGMDGQRDVAGIVRWAEEELGIKPSTKEVRNVIATLGDLGFIEGAVAAAAAHIEAPLPTRPTPPPTPAVSRAPAPSTASPSVAQPMAAKSTTRWDQPTAMGESDQYLGKGVVTGAKQPTTPAPDVELGIAGARAAKSPEMPRADAVELGAPGARGQQRPAARAENIALGAPGRSDTDLAAELPMSRADVKEAVRASQIHKSVEPPVEAKAPEAPPVEAKPAIEVPARPSIESPARPSIESPARPSIESPARPPVESRTPQAPRPAISPVLLAALVLVALALGAVAVYKYVFKKKETPAPAVQPTPEPPKPEPPKPPPAPETVKLAVEQPPVDELKPTAPGTVQVILANDTVVKEGDAVAKLAGYRQPENQLTFTQKQLAKAKTDLENAKKEHETAQSNDNKNGVLAAEKKIANAEKAITDLEAKLATQQAAFDKLVIKAPAAGKVTAVAKQNAKVTPTEVVATLTRDPSLVATFKTAGTVAPATPVLLEPKAGEKLHCSVAQADAAGVKVVCAKDAAPEGTEVTFGGVDPSPPPPPVEEPKGEQPKGEQPKGEQPKGEQPKGEQPKGEQPKGGQPKGEQPKGEPKGEKAGKTETPKKRPPEKGSAAEKGSGEKAGGEKGGEAGSGTTP